MSSCYLAYGWPNFPAQRRPIDFYEYFVFLCGLRRLALADSDLTSDFEALLGQSIGGSLFYVFFVEIMI